MLLYVGPETILPLASILAAISGVILMFWRRTVAAVQAIGRGFARLFKRSTDTP